MWSQQFKIKYNVSDFFNVGPPKEDKNIPNMLKLKARPFPIKEKNKLK